jgi:hypothetical protein
VAGSALRGLRSTRNSGSRGASATTLNTCDRSFQGRRRCAVYRMKMAWIFDNRTVVGAFAPRRTKCPGIVRGLSRTALWENGCVSVARGGAGLRPAHLPTYVGNYMIGRSGPTYVGSYTIARSGPTYVGSYKIARSGRREPAVDGTRIGQTPGAGLRPAQDQVGDLTCGKTPFGDHRTIGTAIALPP